MSILKKQLWIFITILVFAIDRLTKAWVMDNLPLELPVNIFPILNLYFTFNTGAAFSFLNQAGGWQEWLFISIAIIVGIWLIIWQFKLGTKELWLKISLALILGGTLGNLYDRIIYHKVIDFLDFYYDKWHYPVFNIADSAICVGAILLIIDTVRKEKGAKGKSVKS